MTFAHTALPKLDAEMLQQTAALAEPLLEVCRYATAGGKQVRARLLLAAARRCDALAIRAATALEMLHAATLLQDDIFDSGSLRRGRTAAHLRFGGPLTILASDWLLIRALELAAELDPVFFRCLARASAAMVQAEACELTPLPLQTVEETQAHAERTCRGKTASLFGTALCGAAVLRQLTDEQRAGWETLGIEMGLTYQMVDDCVDLYGAEDAAGKTLGHDLASGCFTLPVLLALQSLQERGIAVSLKDLQVDLQAGCLAADTFSCLQAAIYSQTVRAQVQQRLAQRLAQHAQRAITLGLNDEVVGECTSGMRARLAACFPERLDFLTHQQPCASTLRRLTETGQDRA